MNTKVPEFPTDAAFQHGFEAFQRAYVGIDWICPAFNFAVALAQMSIAMGRKYVIHEQGTHYPNFYQVILGRSHLAAKSPTLNRALEGIDYLRRNIDPPEQIHIVSSLNSGPAFKSEFATHENGDPDNPMDWYSHNNGIRAFLPLDELGTLLSKARKSGTEDIPIELTRLYNPSDTPIENNTRQDKTYGEGWSINILGCSTLTWYERFITQGDFSSGFLNRFVFYLHDQQEIKPRFNPVEVGALGVWRDILIGVAQQSMQHYNPDQYTLSDDAFQKFSNWHKKVYEYLLEDPEDIKREASARIVSQVLKLALVYSVISNATNNKQIGVPALESAQKVGQYWGKCMGLTLDEIDFDRFSKNERKVMDAVKKLTETQGECTKRTLRQIINYKTMSSNELNKSLEDLVNADLLDYTESDRKKLIILK